MESSDENAGEPKSDLTPVEGEIVDAVEKTALAGLTAEQATQVINKGFDAATASANAVKEIASSAAASQKEVQETIRSAIDSKSEAINECAKNMDTDEGRIRIAELEIEREREKTKQAEAATEANKDNNFTFRYAFKYAAIGVCCVVAVVIGGPKMAKAFLSNAKA